jgi:SAM-dependent methyltransferase
LTQNPTTPSQPSGPSEAPGTSKADFDHIYDQPDPRAYFRTLGELDYSVPQQAQPAVRAVLRRLREARPEQPPRVLDVCCSYGINAALLRTDVTLAQLYDRYAGPALSTLRPAELAEQDAAFYAAHRAGSVWVAGLDVAQAAVGYACRVGLLDRGWAEDLEARDPSDGLAGELADLDLVLTTGGVGYIGERTFDRLLRPSAGRSRPWVLAMVLRVFPYDDIAATLGEHGFRTERLEELSFPQRRFASDQERAAALRDLAALGLDPAGRELDGWYHASPYLSRPAEDVERLPLRDLLVGVV